MVNATLDKLLARFAAALPPLVLGMACLRLAEWAAHSADLGLVLLPSLGNDLLALLRHLPLLLLLALPGLLVERRAWRLGWLAVVWSLLLAGAAALAAYQHLTGNALGADLFGYSWQEIRTILGDHARPDPAMLLPLLAALAVLLGALIWCERAAWPQRLARSALVLLCLSIPALLVLPAQIEPAARLHQDQAALSLNKLAFFTDDSLAYAARSLLPAAPLAGATDARYPFLRPETTPDTLGPQLRTAARAPDIVLIVVEGLGRTFSGPGARLGSFTPFLDELSARSLYFDNFLAPQGRTFAVLPSILGSLPFGPGGFNALAPPRPAHASLISLLKAQGYRTRFFTGTNPDFDNQGSFLREEGTDVLAGIGQFGAGYQRANEWGYADRDLFDFQLAYAAKDRCAPCLSVIQTVSMHDPFTFPGQAAYEGKVEQRLDQLGVAADKRQPYRERRNIFASVLYTDDALRQYFAQAEQQEGYANTVFLITGDHRLPELPMDTRMERYHVPLIVYSPLLKTPQHIQSVSSHFDLAPALLAYLSHNYGLKTPAKVTWLGTGLDLEPGFRNQHAFPLKQTKTMAEEYISGTVMLSQGRLYNIANGMEVEPVDNPEGKAIAGKQLDAFRAASAAIVRLGELAPRASLAPDSAYSAQGRTLRAPTLAADLGSLWVAGASAQAAGGEVRLQARIANRGESTSPPFVPLLVVTDAHGNELGEVSGKAYTLAPAGSVELDLRGRFKLAPGTYFVSIIVSHPDTGKPIGLGQYHMPVRF
jgi:uncharacterized sulfatase